MSVALPVQVSVMRPQARVLALQVRVLALQQARAVLQVDGSAAYHLAMCDDIGNAAYDTQGARAACTTCWFVGRRGCERCSEAPVTEHSPPASDSSHTADAHGILPFRRTGGWGGGASWRGAGQAWRLQGRLAVGRGRAG